MLITDECCTLDVLGPATISTRHAGSFGKELHVLRPGSDADAVTGYIVDHA